MKNKIIAICLVLCFCLSLCGCQLARPDGYEVSRDRLIGCFITTEHLDLFDFEAYFNDNANKLISGGDIVLDGDTSAYQGRIYAEFYEEEYKDADGISHTTYNYRFRELEGIAYFAPMICEEDGQTYTTFQSDPGLNEVKNHVKSHNEDTYYTELSATVYAPVDAEDEFDGDEICFYMNPVYQDAEGRVYLVSGSGTAMNSTGAGMIMSKKISEEYKTTINGEEKTGGGSVEICFETAYVPSLLRVIEMDGEGNVASISELEPTALPESYTPHESTAYIIAESVAYAADGRQYVERSFIEPEGEDKDIFVLVECESGYLVEDYCKVEWD